MSSLLGPVASPILLRDLPVLVVDCQATSSLPARGHLLEVGWAIASASQTSAPEVTTRLVRLPEGVSLPPRVRRITGLTEDDLALGSDPEAVFAELAAAAGKVSQAAEWSYGLTVAHFSSFEERYLRALRYRSAPEARFPFRFLCTHRLSRRLLPELPRLSLRAVAGYFGERVPELRRSSDHVAATIAVWKACLSLLEERENTRTLDELSSWLAATAATARPSRREYPMPPFAWRGLPRKPGVYRMLGSGGDVLYVGKATSLRDRVGSYFRPSAPHPAHTLEMLSQARDVEIVVTGSALEAALLEAEEIQRRAPSYNKALRLGGRKLVYADRCLCRFCDEPDPRHPVGPLPQSSAWPAFAALRRTLDEVERDEEAAPSEELFGCDERTFAAAVRLLKPRLGGGSLLGFGAREWRARRERRPEEEDGELHLEIVTPRGRPRRPTPEELVEHFVEIVVRSSHLVRRAHWHRLLDRSVLVWRGREGERLSLALATGAVFRDAVADRPPMRSESVDVAAYDRLTVVTREIRRLVSERRRVELHVTPGHRLDAKKLARMLSWV